MTVLAMRPPRPRPTHVHRRIPRTTPGAGPGPSRLAGTGEPTSGVPRLGPPASAPAPPDPDRAAFVDGLRLLARRDLSAAQLRDRLAHRGHADAAIDSALARLTREGAVDDHRVAAGRARAELLIRGRGRARARRQIEALGIDPDTARDAVDEAASGLDDRALVERALDRRLRSRLAGPLDAGTMARLHRYLVSQGFPPGVVLAALRARGRSQSLPSEDD